MTVREAAKLIDISAVRSRHGEKDLNELVELGREYHFINLHVLPSWISELSKKISNLDDVYVGSPVGFPAGGQTTQVKMFEARQMIEDGVDEMDIVMNIGKFKSGEYGYVEDELGQIISYAKGKIRATKVIIEINTLTDEEIEKACALVIASGADFVKTGTGWVPGMNGANIERIRRMKQICSDRIKIKAAGGIRTLDDFMCLVDMGVERMGINTKSAVEIIKTIERQ